MILKGKKQTPACAQRTQHTTNYSPSHIVEHMLTYSRFHPRHVHPRQGHLLVRPSSFPHNLLKVPPETCSPKAGAPASQAQLLPPYGPSAGAGRSGRLGRFHQQLAGRSALGGARSAAYQGAQTAKRTQEAQQPLQCMESLATYASGSGTETNSAGSSEPGAPAQGSSRASHKASGTAVDHDSPCKKR